MVRKNTLFSLRKKSIKHTVFVYFLLTVLFSTFSLVVFAYIISVNIVTEKVLRSFEENTAYVHNSLRNEIVYISRMMNFFFIDNDIKKIVSNPAMQSYEFLQSVESIEARIRNNLLISFFDYVNETN